MYLAIRSDKPEAEIYLLDPTGRIKTQKQWLADRQLASELPGEVDRLLQGSYRQLLGVIIFRGPGSFTGLRIGIAVANAVAYAQSLPIVGTTGADWLTSGAKYLANGQNDRIVLPKYGAGPHITLAKS